MLLLGLVVVGIYATEIQYINLSGNITFNVDDKSLYVQDVRVQEYMQSNPYSLKEQGNFIPGYINGEFKMNLGTYNNTYGGLMVYFDIINTMDENRNSYMYDVTASTTQTDGEIEVQAVVDNEEGYIPFGSITPSEITSTTSPTATVILTITSPQGIEVDLSQITITITRREPVEITDFTFSLNNTDHTASVTNYTGSDTIVTIPSSISVVETTDGTKYYKGSQYTVTGIGSSAFEHNTTITQVVLPDTLQTIGDDVFSNCSLTEITIPSSVTSIGDYAFWGCDHVFTITIDSETIYNATTSLNAFGGLFEGATTIRVLAEFARDGHEYISLEYFTSVDKNVVIDGKTYWEYTK